MCFCQCIIKSTSKVTNLLSSNRGWFLHAVEPGRTVGNRALTFFVFQRICVWDGLEQRVPQLSQVVHPDCCALVYIHRPGSWNDTVCRLCWPCTRKGGLLLQITFNYGKCSDMIRSVEGCPVSPHTPSLASTVMIS